MTWIVDTSERLEELKSKLLLLDEFGIDFETTSEHPHPEAPLHVDKMKIVGVGFGYSDENEELRAYIPVAHVGSSRLIPLAEVIVFLSQVLGDSGKVVWAHNIKFEILVCNVLRVQHRCMWRCSLIAQFMLGKSLDGGRGLKLKPAVKEFLGHDMELFGDISLGKRLHEVSVERVADYCSDDALRCYQLGKFFEPQLKELRLWKAFVDMECRFTPVLVHMYECGCAVDRHLLSELSTSLQKVMKEVAEKFQELVGCAVSSNKQVSIRLYDELKWWPVPSGLKRGKSGVYSVAEPVRETVKKTLPKDSLGMKAMKLKDEYQGVAKLESTYTVALIKRADIYFDGRVRSNFNQNRTATGRLASSDPNLQNIPIRSDLGREIRRAFIAEPGWLLLLADYSQADLVMMAHLSQDEMLMKAYKEGLDLHQQTADFCGCSRSTGKVINLGNIYEMRAGTLSETLGISLIKGQILWDKWHSLYPGVRRYFSKMHAFARKYGYVRTITGRIRYLPDIDSNSFGRRSHAEREASNTPDQGSVADVIKIAMRNLYEEWKDRGVLYDYYTRKGKVKILSQVHDEVICEARVEFAEEAAKDLQRHMETDVTLRVPMTAGPGIGRTWLEAKKDSKRREKGVAEVKNG
jgi:DNA polymerase I